MAENTNVEISNPIYMRDCEDDEEVADDFTNFESDRVSKIT